MLNTIRNQIERNIAGDNIIKDIRNLFRLKNKIGNGIKDETLREIRIYLNLMKTFIINR